MIRLSGCMAIALLALVSCAPLTTYYKPGGSVARAERDTTDCKVRALRDAPVATQWRRLPPEFVPPRQVCDRNGENCRTIRGYYVPGEIVSFDPNEALRRRVERQCMADRGYAQVSIPQCPDSVAAAVPPAATRTFPALTDKSCVIRNSDGTYQIVNRR